MITEQKVVEYPFELASGTLEADFTREQIKLKKGIIQPLEVIFPPGPSGLVGVRCKQGSHVLVPQRDTDWLVGDDITYPHYTPIDLMSEPFTLTVEGYNADTVYDHTIIFRFTLITPVPDRIAEIIEVLREDWPHKTKEYLAAISEITSEIADTRLLLSDFVVPILREMNEREKIERLEGLRSQSIEELARG